MPRPHLSAVSVLAPSDPRVGRPTSLGCNRPRAAQSLPRQQKFWPRGEPRYVLVRLTVHFYLWLDLTPLSTFLVEHKSTTAGLRTQDHSWGGHRSIARGSRRITAADMSGRVSAPGCNSKERKVCPRPHFFKSELILPSSPPPLLSQDTGSGRRRWLAAKVIFGRGNAASSTGVWPWGRIVGAF